MTLDNAMLNIIVALDCEARVLIDAYRLKKQTVDAPYALYSNASQSINVMVSGIGALRVASAVGFLFAYFNRPKHAFFLNLGIAGSQSHNIGDLRAIHKITDAITGNACYPHRMKKMDLPSECLLSVAQVKDHYPETGLVDMEGYAFFHTANLYVPLDQIHCVKLISDNSVASREAITKQKVIAWMRDQFASIDHLIEILVRASAAEAHYYPEIDLSDWQARWHFSHYQQNQLREYLRRWAQWGQGDALAQLSPCHSAADVLEQFSQTLASMEYHWHD